MKYKVAVLGTGNIAVKNHIPALLQDERVEIVALCGQNLDKAKTLAQQFQISNAYNNTEELYTQCKPNIVINATPNHLHYPLTIQALKHNCHVLCEKPPALQAKQAHEMADLAKQKGKILAYNFQLRQSAEYITLKNIQARGQLGNVYHIKANFLRRRGIPGWGNFTNKAIQGGGALMDIGIHVLDLALGLLAYQMPDKIVANTYDFIGKQGGKGLMGEWNSETFDVEDACMAYLSFPNNASIMLSSAFALNTSLAKNLNLEVYGSSAGAILFPLTLFSENFGELTNTSFPLLEETNAQFKNTFSFLNACEGKESNICTAIEGAILQDIVQKIYESAHNLSNENPHRN